MLPIKEPPGLHENLPREATVYPLVTEFLGSMTVPAILGKMSFGQSPPLLDGIDVLDDSFTLMALGLARSLPTPSSKRAWDKLHENPERLGTPLDTVTEGRNRGIRGDSLVM